MAASTTSATEDFLRIQFAAAMDEHRPIGPTAKAILETLMTETANHVGAEEVRGSKAADPNRFVLKLFLTTLTERFSMHTVTLFLSLG